MTNTLRRIITATLSAVTVFSFSSAALDAAPLENSGSGYLYIHSGSFFDDDYEELEKLSSEYAALDSSEENAVGTNSIQKAPPSSIDLSTHPAFPPIQDQGNVNSCAPFSIVYYQFTYEVNRAKGISSASLNNCYSPDWAYYSIANNGGSTDSNDVYHFTRERGAVKWNELTPTLNYNSYNPMPSNEAKLAALSTRINYVDNHKIKTKVNGKYENIIGKQELTAVKNELANGHVLRATSWTGWCVDVTSNGEDCVVQVVNANNKKHSFCIVGYDDNIWVDLNSNTVRDAGEVGAFKIADSAGTDEWNNGYVWFLYDSLNKNTSVSGSWPNSYNGTRYPAFCTKDDDVNFFNFITVKDYKNYCVVKTVYNNVQMSYESQYTAVQLCGELLHRTAATTIRNTKTRSLEAYMTYGPLISDPILLTLGDSYFYVHRNSNVPASQFSAELVDNKGNRIANMTGNGVSYSSGKLTFMLGDVNYDFSLNAKDITAIQRLILTPANASDLQWYLADYDGDGSVNAKDITALMRAMQS